MFDHHFPTTSIEFGPCPHFSVLTLPWFYSVM
jgi:hypothetical protein